ncbi:MAG: hypothetical protein WCT04_06190 [Planctomycetota bacterium]
MMKMEDEKDDGFNIVPVIVGVVVAVVVIYGGYTLINRWLNNTTSQVQAKILNAVRDDDVGVTGAKESVSRIVVEMEITFPYGNTPDNLDDLVVRDDNEAVVDVNWGRTQPEKNDIEDRNITKWIFREAFFPIDFKQGKLYGKNKYLCYFRMPPVTIPVK